MAAGPSSISEGLTKPTIILSLALAAAIQLPVVSDVWAPLPWMTGLVFACALIGGRWLPRATRAAVMFTTYLIPAIFFLLRGRFIVIESFVWVAAVLGVIMSSRSALRWSLPARWRLPLVYSALIAAFTWPLVVFREVDFQLLDGLPLFGATAALTATTVMAGVLWFDWLFAAYAESDDTSYEREILLPLGLGWVVTACIGVYQMFGDMTFMSSGFWIFIRRATGSLMDANVFGVACAIWGPALVAVVGARGGSGRAWPVAAIALPLSWAGLWASGSRSAMPLALVGLLGLLIGVWRSTRSTKVAVGLGAALLTLVGLVVAALVLGGSAIDNPVTRFIRYFAPEWSLGWASETAGRLWTRDGYGTLSTEVIRRFPWFGVGLGAFSELVPIFSHTFLPMGLPGDNAQNWFRHQVAELGIIGSLGWLVWSASFLWLLLTARTRPGRQMTGTVARLLVVGFGLISLVGMPAANIAMSFTFWTLAFWFFHETEPSAAPVVGHAAPSTLAWAGMWALVLVHLAGVTYDGMTSLRPPVRAQQADWDYVTGVYLPRNVTNYEEFHWAKRRAVAVAPAPTRWMALTVGVNHLDLETVPVDVHVWINRDLSLRTRLRSSEPITRYVHLTGDQKRVIVETGVNRFVQGRDGDNREFGLLIRWHFVDAPPEGARVIGVGG